MSWPMMLFTFVNAWWITMFFVMPFFIRPRERPDTTGYAAAPQPMRWKKALLVNTAASVAITVLLALLIDSGLFHLDTMV